MTGCTQQWASKHPLDPDTERFESLGDHRLRFQVVEPFYRYRWSLDSPNFSFDLEYTVRFPTFDYADCHGGNPLAAYEPYGGHYEQALTCRGVFQAHKGPRQGEVRRIDCLAHRDHSWTYRFAQDPPWEQRRPRAVGRFPRPLLAVGAASRPPPQRLRMAAG
ncbi:MAG: hypothetical protein KatS3mg011_2293 [Acidimicrobiia bacterium]|nr:MAG: hypothetical protein KatS3mg011_2293 [Acidimicrobiia bacterium]